ncbi:LysE family translocator [Ectobacillus panaciterrae]|uniref:LysE family translocator n=1 Tax=Ectobacillus panaciterrae TaxID=363872 RepID=UPI000426D6B3|nr:LysE family transporter [Ectobacillus panaciterrae]
MLEFIVKGIVLGLCIAAPVGPIGILCIRRSLEQGRWAGFVSGLGAATADALYGLLAGSGLTVLSAGLIQGRGMLQILGGIFLLYLGFHIFRSRPSSETAQGTKSDWIKAYISTFLLTLTNPLTLLSFFGIFAGLGIGQGEAYGNMASFVAGVFIGSALWWLFLSFGAASLRGKLTYRHFLFVNRASGTLIVLFGILALYKVAAG